MESCNRNRVYEIWLEEIIVLAGIYMPAFRKVYQAKCDSGTESS